MWLRHGHVVFKSSIFVVQRATATKNGVEFRQGSIGTIRGSLATSRGREIISDRQTRELTYWQALLYEQRLQKYWKCLMQQHFNIFGQSYKFIQQQLFLPLPFQVFFANPTFFCHSTNFCPPLIFVGSTIPPSKKICFLYCWLHFLCINLDPF